MEQHHVFVIEIAASEARKRIHTIVTALGYGPIQPMQEQAVLQYQRGSRLSSLVSFSPKGWGGRLAARVSSNSEGSSQVNLDYDINTFGQMVTQKERDFWKAEIKDVERSVRNGSVDIAQTMELRGSALRQNLIVMAVITPFAIVAGILADSLLVAAIGGGLAVALVIGIFALWDKYHSRGRG